MRKANSILAVIAISGAATSLRAQAPGAQPEKPLVSVSVSARASGRRELPIPPAGKEGIELSLRDAIAIGLANNVDLRVAIAGSEGGAAGVLQSRGIFDPVAGIFLQINDNVSPQASSLGGGSVTKARTDDANLTVSQLVPTGGTLSLGFNNEKSKTNSSFFFVNPQYAVRSFLDLRQPLLRNFGFELTKRGILISKNNQAVNDQTFVQSVQSTITAVEQAYWNLVYARQNLEVKKQSKDLATELYRITKIKIDVGSQAPIDLVQTESGVAQRELDIISARSAVGDAEDQLKRLLNFSSVSRWNDHVIPTDEVRVEPVRISPDEGVEKALEDRPEVISAEFSAASARITFDFQRNQLLPQLDLHAQYGYAGLGGPTQDPGPDGIYGTADDPVPTRFLSGGYGDAFREVRKGDFHNWTLGLNFSIPILNRNARGALGIARWNLESSLATLEQTRQNVTVEVRRAARAVDTSLQSIEAAGKARELAERNVDAEKKKYDNGLVTSFEVLSNQNDLSAARSAELQALTLYRNAMVAYHQAIGDLLSWKDVQVTGILAAKRPGRESLSAGK
jgi:outer membrane protein TolC